MEYKKNETIRIRPAHGQFVIDNLPMITLTVCGATICGMENYWLEAIKGITGYAVLIMLLCLAYRLTYMLGTRYEITPEQLIRRHGVFTRKADYVELYRIVDYAEQKTLLQRIAGLKTVTVYSGDRTHPEIRLKGIHGRSRITEEIRSRVEQSKRRRGVYEITNR